MSNKYKKMYLSFLRKQESREIGTVFPGSPLKTCGDDSFRYFRHFSTFNLRSLFNSQILSLHSSANCSLFSGTGLFLFDVSFTIPLTSLYESPSDLNLGRRSLFDEFYFDGQIDEACCGTPRSAAN
jgi:hypothetical protein